MYPYLARRALFAAVTMLATLTLVFFLIRVLPGDPTQIILGDMASEQARSAMRERLGLNLPLPVQYFEFLSGALVGDWGDSLVTARPVLAEILRVLPYTIELTVAALALGTVIGVPLGIWAATHRNLLPDYVIRVASLLGLSFPAFVSAILLLLFFAIQLRWFPVISEAEAAGPGRLWSLALPAVNLGLIMAAYITRVTRSAMLEVLSEDYVRTAMAKGVPQHVVVWRHALRNALLPIVTVVGLYLGILIGNSVLTEIVFSRPGLGKLIVGAINQRDYTLLQGLLVFYTFIVVVVNLATDLTYGLIDPRVRQG